MFRLWMISDSYFENNVQKIIGDSLKNVNVQTELNLEIELLWTSVVWNKLPCLEQVWNLSWWV